MNEERLYGVDYSDPERYADEISKFRTQFFGQLEKGALMSVKLGADVYRRELAIKEDELEKRVNSLGDMEFTGAVTIKGIEFRINGVIYSGFPAADYHVVATNVSDKTSIKISEFCSLDSRLHLPSESGEAVLHSASGSRAMHSDFEPFEAVLRAENPNIKITAEVSRATNGAWPYATISTGKASFTVATGWAGHWETEFKYGCDHFSAKIKQKTLSAVLLPNESVRAPRIVLCYSEGDDTRAWNLWRRLFISRFLPNRRNGAKYFKSPVTLNFWGGTHEDVVKSSMDVCKKYGVIADYVWFDAQWNKQDSYVPADKPVWHSFLGDWKPNPKFFKDGSFKSVSDAIHEYGAKFMLWAMYEDGREEVGKELTFGRESYYDLAIPCYDKSKNIGLRFSDEKVVDKLLDFFRMMHKEQGVDVARFDSWGYVHDMWFDNDKKLSRELSETDETLRLGITENRHVLGIYRFWDTLYREIPDFFLDNTCAGGCRMEIEMASRGVTLWRSDSTHGVDKEETQVHTQRLARWIPFQAIGAVSSWGNDYETRSLYSGSVGFNGRSLTEEAGPEIKRTFDEINALLPYWYGDYYQLLDQKYDKESWQAYEHFREDLDEGFFTVIRRENAEGESVNLKLCGLTADAVYEIKEALSDEVFYEASGKELSESGITVALEKRSIKNFVIKKK